jgi:hypothetical protein
MKAVRLHQYQEHPVVEEVAESEITTPYNVIVRIGGAEVEAVERSLSGMRTVESSCTR